MADGSTHATLARLGADYAHAFAEAGKIVDKLKTTDDRNLRADLFTQLRSLDSRRVRTLEEMKKLD